MVHTSSYNKNDRNHQKEAENHGKGGWFSDFERLCGCSNAIDGEPAAVECRLDHNGSWSDGPNDRVQAGSIDNSNSICTYSLEESELGSEDLPRRLILQEEHKVIAPLQEGLGVVPENLYSCNSSVSSLGIPSAMSYESNLMPPMRIGFPPSPGASKKSGTLRRNNVTLLTSPVFDLSSLPTRPSPHTSYRVRPDPPSACDDAPSEKSARFDDALNTTRYIPSRLRDEYGEAYCIDEEAVSEEKTPSPNQDNDDVKVSGWNPDKAFEAMLDSERFNHQVLGTSTTDEETKPHVLTISLMDNLQDHLPYCKRGELFWLKYSMVRDGANMKTLLNRANGSKYTILAVETMDGEVFGAFTAKPWHITHKFYGSQYSFLWRVKTSKNSSSSSSLEVFPFAGHNQNIQLCNNDRIAVGGGCPNDCDSSQCTNDDLSHVRLTEWGFGLAFNSFMQQGTSSPCLTFESPSLSKLHSDGSLFEVANIEVWTLTPCTTVRDARRMEMNRMTVEK